MRVFPKYIFFIFVLLAFKHINFSQEMFTLRDKKEIFCGLNRDISFNDNVFLGINIGYSTFLQDKTNFHYRLDLQHTKRYFINTQSNPHDDFYYKNLVVQSIVLNNMFSYRLYQKRHDRLYCDIGAYLGINLWQDKSGQTDGYYQTQEDFEKTYIFLPFDLGIHIGCGLRLGKQILLKPELRFGVFSFDKLFEESGFFDEMMRNTALPLSFNMSYLF